MKTYFTFILHFLVLVLGSHQLMLAGSVSAQSLSGCYGIENQISSFHNQSQVLPHWVIFLASNTVLFYHESVFRIEILSSINTSKDSFPIGSSVFLFISVLFNKHYLTALGILWSRVMTLSRTGSKLLTPMTFCNSIFNNCI